jgi:hypothetical protein
MKIRDQNIEGLRGDLLESLGDTADGDNLKVVLSSARFVRKISSLLSSTRRTLGLAMQPPPFCSWSKNGPRLLPGWVVVVREADGCPSAS